MKTALKILLGIFRYIMIVLLAMLSIATLLGGSYLQTTLLWLLIISLTYWPSYFVDKWGRAVAVGLRFVFISLLLAGNMLLFKPKPKESIYLSNESQEALMDIYDKRVSLWPKDTEDLIIQTKYGKVHILACGKTGNPPLVMIHAASMGAHHGLKTFSLYSPTIASIQLTTLAKAIKVN